MKYMLTMLAFILVAMPAQAITTWNRITKLTGGDWEAAHGQLVSTLDGTIFYPPDGVAPFISALYTHKTITGTGPKLGETYPNYEGGNSGGGGGTGKLDGNRSTDGTAPENGYSVVVTDVSTTPATVNRTFFADPKVCGAIFYSVFTKTGRWQFDHAETFRCTDPPPVLSGGSSAGTTRWKPMWKVDDNKDTGPTNMTQWEKEIWQKVYPKAQSPN